MKKLIFFIPAIIVIVFVMIFVVSGGAGMLSHIHLVWIVIFGLAGALLSKKMFWGGLIGMIPAIHIIYLSTQSTGQVIDEKPIGIIILVYYLACGYFVYRKKNTN